MSQQVLRITRPTKIELIRLRRRLITARRLHKILKDRLVLLSQELIALIKDAINLRNELHAKLQECQGLLIKSYSLSSPDIIESYIAKRYVKRTVVLGSRVYAGVRIPVYQPGIISGEPIKDITAPLITELSIKCYEDAYKILLRLAEVEEGIMLIGNEVKRVRRRSNALEYFLIPRILNTIKYLRMKFEERDRENRVRMKRVKETIIRRKEM